MFGLLYTGIGLFIGLFSKPAADLTHSLEADCEAHSLFMEQSLAETASDATLACYRKYKCWCHFLSKTYSSRTLVHIVLPDTSSSVKVNVGLYL